MICTYQDHADDEEEVETSALIKLDQDPQNPEQIVFPVKLHNMLSQVDKQGLSHVVSWAVHGRCFLVHKKDEFVSKILASWFRQSKFASFQRQLNLYGFKRITTGPDKGGYYHELFLRSKPFLCHKIERVKIKGSRPGRIKAFADAEPDFYRMKAMPAETDHSEYIHSNSNEDQEKLQPQHQLYQHKGNTIHGGERQDSSGERDQAPDSRPGTPNHDHDHQRSFAAQLKRDDGSDNTNSNNRGPQDLHANDFGMAFHDLDNSRTMSFLASKPQPMPVSRQCYSSSLSSSSLAPVAENPEEKKQDGCETNNDPFSSRSLMGQGLFQILRQGCNRPSVSPPDDKDDDNYLNEQTHDLTTPLQFPCCIASNTNTNTNTTQRSLAATPQDHENNQHQKEASPGNFSLMSHANVHPNLDASGRSNLEARREQNNQQQHPRLSSLTFTSNSASSSMSRLTLPPHQQQGHPFMQSDGSHKHNDGGQGHLRSLSIDMFDMSNEFLSEYLPTAQALTLEGLFDSSPENSPATGSIDYLRPQRSQSEPLQVTKPRQRRRHSLDDDESPGSGNHSTSLFFHEHDLSEHHEV